MFKPCLCARIHTLPLRVSILPFRPLLSSETLEWIPKVKKCELEGPFKTVTLIFQVRLLNSKEAGDVTRLKQGPGSRSGMTNKSVHKF